MEYISHKQYVLFCIQFYFTKKIDDCHTEEYVKFVLLKNNNKMDKCIHTTQIRNRTLPEP